MNPVLWFGDALVTVTRTGAAPLPGSLPAATARPVRVVHVDGFDARYLEPEPADRDLCERLGRAGWLCVGVPTAGVTAIATPPMGTLEPHDRGLPQVN